MKPAIALILFFLAATTCLAAPAGNPAGPVLLEGEYPTKFSLQAETVLNRELKSDSSGKQKFSGTFYTAKVSFYLGKKLDVYGFAGTYDGKLKHFPNSSYSIDTKMDAVWGAGISYCIREWEYHGGVMRLGADAKYRQFRPDVDTVKYDREKIQVTNAMLKFKEWQTSLGFSYQYKKFAPYMGLKYSDMAAHERFTEGVTFNSDNTVRSKNIIGLFYGIDFLAADNIALNIEGRTIDENAVNLDLSVRF